MGGRAERTYNYYDFDYEQASGGMDTTTTITTEKLTLTILISVCLTERARFFFVRMHFVTQKTKEYRE
jgi:hypothetical protein